MVTKYSNLKRAAPELAIQAGQTCLLDLVVVLRGITSDAALAAQLKMDAASISRVRNKHRRVGSRLMLKIHELTDLPLELLRGVTLGRYGLSVSEVIRSDVKIENIAANSAPHG